jgi:hypothetical protein
MMKNKKENDINMKYEIEEIDGYTYIHCNRCNNKAKWTNGKFDVDKPRLFPPGWKMVIKANFAFSNTYFVCPDCYSPEKDFNTM